MARKKKPSNEGQTGVPHHGPLMTDKQAVEAWEENDIVCTAWERRCEVCHGTGEIISVEWVRWRDQFTSKMDCGNKSMKEVIEEIGEEPARDVNACRHCHGRKTFPTEIGMRLISFFAKWRDIDVSGAAALMRNSQIHAARTGGGNLRMS